MAEIMTAAYSVRIPVACVPGAIPAAEREMHFALGRRLFTALALERAPLNNGYEFRFAVDALAPVTQFIANERLCCPFMRFVVELEAGADTIVLRMTGPSGTRETLDAELNPGQRQSAECGCHV